MLTPQPESPGFSPAKFAEMVRSYAPGAVAAAFMSTIVLTGAGHVATWFASRPLSPALRTGFAICWILALGTLPLLLVSRAAFLRAKTRVIPKVYWIQSVVQLTWLALLGWYATPAYAPVLFFVLCLLLFNDVRMLYSAPALRALYSSMWVGQIAVLLLVDAFGGSGLLALMHAQPRHAAFVLLAELCVGFLNLIIIQIVGKGHQERDLAFHKNAELEATLRAMKAERGVLARSCDFLLQGLSAGRFSHDVSSPISVMLVEVERLRGKLSEQSDGRLDPQVARSLERLNEAGELTQALTRSLARSLREPADFVAVRLSDLIDEAIGHAAQALQRHAIVMREPVKAFDDSAVVVSREHAAAIGNVLVNGVLQRPDLPIEIAGASATDYFCKVSIRDWGVPPDQQNQALTRVQAHMSLLAEDANVDRLGEYDGHGIGLLLTKALVVRWGGWLAARAPETGAGLRFELVLPKIAPHSIPDDLNAPERVLVS